MKILRKLMIFFFAVAWLTALSALFVLTAASARTQLRVAYSSISGAGIVTWLALDKGLFAKNDLDVELIYVAGSQAMQSLLSGTTPIGIQGIEPVFRVNAHGSDTVMLLGIVTKPPFSIMVRPEIKDFRELKGKPMGITRYGSSTDMLLRLSLEKWGFKPETDVPILQMGGVPPILAGMESRKIVGGPLSQPTLARAKKEGYRELADVADLVPEYQVAGVVTRRAFIKQNREVVRGFVKAIAEGMVLFSKDPESVRQVMKTRFKIDDQSVIEETQKDYPRYAQNSLSYPNGYRNHQIVSRQERAGSAVTIDRRSDRQSNRTRAGAERVLQQFISWQIGTDVSPHTNLDFESDCQSGIGPGSISAHTGIPTREGIGNITRAIKAEGRFTDRNIAYEEVAEPRFAIEVARELGYKVP